MCRTVSNLPCHSSARRLGRQCRGDCRSFGGRRPRLCPGPRRFRSEWRVGNLIRAEFTEEVVRKKATRVASTLLPITFDVISNSFHRWLRLVQEREECVAPRSGEDKKKDGDEAFHVRVDVAISLFICGCRRPMNCETTMPLVDVRGVGVVILFGGRDINIFTSALCSPNCQRTQQPIRQASKQSQVASRCHCPPYLGPWGPLPTGGQFHRRGARGPRPPVNVTACTCYMLERGRELFYVKQQRAEALSRSIRIRRLFTWLATGPGSTGRLPCLCPL